MELGQVNQGGLLSDFVECHFQAVSDLHLFCNFVCHRTTMQQAGLVAQEIMVDAIIYMQKMIDNRYTRRPCLDPIIDLAARFPGLELTHAGVLHSRTHMNKVN